MQDRRITKRLLGTRAKELARQIYVDRAMRGSTEIYGCYYEAVHQLTLKYRSLRRFLGQPDGRLTKYQRTGTLGQRATPESTVGVAVVEPRSLFGIVTRGMPPALRDRQARDAIIAWDRQVRWTAHQSAKRRLKTRLERMSTLPGVVRPLADKRRVLSPVAQRIAQTKAANLKAIIERSNQGVAPPPATWAPRYATTNPDEEEDTTTQD